MKHLFYFFAVFPILFEMSSFLHPQRIMNFRARLKETASDDYTANQYAYYVFSLGYIIWAFCGIFTFQWPAFILLFIMGLFSKKNKYLLIADAFLTFIILLFICLNAYHFKIDLFQLILKTIC